MVRLCLRITSTPLLPSSITLSRSPKTTFCVPFLAQRDADAKNLMRHRQT